jgi:polar amino acid transport system substrate-binding protein
MINNKLSLLALIVALVALALGAFHPAKDTSEKPNKETAYERVLRTQTLRCGYIPEVVNLTKDPNTGAIGGMDREITEALGKKLGLKVVWAEETGWATLVSGLNTARFDALCNAAWVSPNMSKEGYYSRPYYYQPLFTAVRLDDHRFDENLGNLDDEKISIASMDGDNPRFVAEEEFPKAKIYTLPDMAGDAAVLDSVAMGKADATFEDVNDFEVYNQHNPNKLKLVQFDKPLRVFPVAYVLPLGDEKFRAMINAAFDELIYGGQIEKILKRYEQYPNSFIPIERPHTTNAVNASPVQEAPK